MKECIILAGGLGTRLQSVVKDVPKCMAEVANQPFLLYLMKYLDQEKFTHIILSLGHKHEVILEWLETQTFNNITVSHVIEVEPLGTGGGIQLAFSKVQGEQAMVINGDTYFAVDTNSLFKFHSEKKADISIALKPMSNFDRYGSVTINSDERILQFNEKKHCKEGIINGGSYIINKSIFEKKNTPEKYSFEQEILEKHIASIGIYGKQYANYFIDIGIPNDFAKANQDFKTLF